MKMNVLISRQSHGMRSVPRSFGMALPSKIKNLIRRVAPRVAPDLWLTATSIRSRRLIEQQSRELGLLDLARQVVQRQGPQVIAGPFSGMIVDVEAFPQHATPKILGSYEDELHDAVEMLISRAPRLVLNIGCAEGYYAVGLAMRLPEAEVIAYDADPRARRATAHNAARNNVAVSARGIVRPHEIELVLAADRRALVVMDCEGGEMELLDPARIPSLRSTDILVEAHDTQVPGCEGAILDRFSRSHDSQIIRPRPTLAKIERAPAWLRDQVGCRAVDERRGSQSWIVLTAAPPERGISDWSPTP